MKIWFSVDLKIVFFFLFQQASLLLALINMFLQFGKSINPSNLLYSGQVGNDILTSHILIQSHYLLLSELYTDFKNLETLSCNASILITVHPSFLFSLQDIIQPLLVVIAILCVPWMLLLKPFYLRHQHNIKKQGVRGELGLLSC